MVWQLDDELWFPNPQWGEDDGLVAVGGDLSANRLLLAYSYGFFPWYAFKMDSEPHWYCPLDRYVIFPNEIHISHSMRQLLRQDKYEVTSNEDFEGVIRGCSTAQQRDEDNCAWLGPNIIEAYTRLYRLGHAASIEVWERPAAGEHREGTASKEGQGRRLVGGLYGVTLRKAFFGESMFSLVPNASKLALIYLAKAMERIGGHFIDCQFETPLFKSMGGRHISYDEYMKILEGS
ncbi:MAG: leucyl/phenylalanyl-tRNA--protein transferase [Prevotella sp.]|nr:leucyl/phenylalanyl-tRNA--protein transferase [Prevotella sp.]